MDTDTGTESAVAAAAATGEPQLALRDGTVRVPRLARATPRGQARPSTRRAPY
ncbi:hypothetical protein ACFQ3Z_04950 [Streptomyces nogalater]